MQFQSNACTGNVRSLLSVRYYIPVPLLGTGLIITDWSDRMASVSGCCLAALGMGILSVRAATVAAHLFSSKSQRKFGAVNARVTSKTLAGSSALTTFITGREDHSSTLLRPATKASD